MSIDIQRRAGPLFGAVLVVVGMTLAIGPVVPSAAALDPTPSPDSSASAPSPSLAPPAAPDPTLPAADPVVEPSPVASPDFTPGPAATPAPTADPLTPTPDPSPSPVPSPGATLTPVAAADGVTIEHFWIDAENRAGDVPNPGELDDATLGLQRFTVYRLRFQVVNGGDSPVEVTPKLLAGEGAFPASWMAVPEVDPVDGLPFYAASDKGSTWDVRHSTIPANRLRLDAASDTSATSTDGLASAGENPAPAVSLPAHSFTEIQFAVRATIYAKYETAYAFRLGLTGTSVLGRVDVGVEMGPEPAPLSDGPAATGKPLEEPTAFRLDAGFAITATLASATVLPDSGFALAAGTFATPHALLNTLTSDACAACHGTHTAQGPTLNGKASPIATVCFSCHNGTGANANVAAQLSSATPNDPSTDSWYQHPATATNTNHISDHDAQEFAGITNRHAECADCHQPHLSDATKTMVTPQGWTASGSIAGASGIAVANGGANTIPEFTWQKTSTLEYQLCFKCHSGYTGLTGWNTTSPSRSQLDKAVELNPANLSYHPVEAAGKNTSTQLDASLAGPSSLRLWSGLSTGSVIRCANCHAASTVVAPAADASLDNHASANRGILVRPYRDRVLRTASQNFTVGDFGLCFACHSTSPFLDFSGSVRPDTNFGGHGLHVVALAGNADTGATNSIDRDGDGLGNALCAECHFNQHGSAFPANSTALEGAQQPATGLVNFAPNVRPFNGTISFVRNANGTSTCTLRCHGKDHNGLSN
ncbi:MAG TPA: cytochrome c3 family protein [Candidatus Limnocylindrales bacterium]|jgi:predicted CXXCH cytochrome family protein